MKRAKTWFIISLVLVLLGTILAGSIKTEGSFTYKELKWETESGIALAANLYVPKSATEQNPAPAVVISHGYLHHSEMFDSYSIEMARRGIVVLELDMYNHGDSDSVNSGVSNSHANGLYDAVVAVSRLPYVDSTRIGLAGHSMGGMMTNTAVALDSVAETPLISSVCLLSADPSYKDADGNYQNQYGARDVAIVAVLHEEFFHQQTYADGSKSSTTQFINTDIAQSFLNGGVDPTGLPRISANTMNEIEVDGQKCVRVIYNMEGIHPQVLVNKVCIKDTVDYFSTTLDAPNPNNISNYIYGTKAFFSALALIGFAMFAISFTLVLLDTRRYGVLKADSVVEPAPLDSKGKKLWFWIGILCTGVIAAIIWPYMQHWGSTHTPKWFPQTVTWTLGWYSLVCGLLTAAFILIFYFAFGKKNGIDLHANGLALEKSKIWRTIELAFMVFFATYSLVFFAEYFFKVDFRWWIVVVRNFGSERVPDFLRGFPFFLVFILALSIGTNCFNYSKISKKDRGGWNLLVMCLGNAFAPICWVVLQYAFFFSTGYTYTATHLMSIGGSAMIGVWILGFVILVPYATILTRIIYKKTRNPWLGGLICALIFTTMMVTTTNATVALF